MAKPIIEGTLLDESHAYTLIEICEMCVIEENTLKELVEFGIIEPKGSGGQWIFSAQAVIRIQKAVRLHQDLAINWPGIALSLELLDEIKELRELLALKNHPI